MLRRQNDRELFDRARRVKGFSLDAMRAATITLVGLGGIGSWIALMLAKLGIGRLVLIDPDMVEDTNVIKTIYTLKNTGKPKVNVLKKVLTRASSISLDIIAIPETLENAARSGKLNVPSMMVSSPDNDSARYQVCNLCLLFKIPGIYAGSSEDGDFGYAFIQKGGQNDACFKCHSPVEFHTGRVMGCAPANAPRFIILAGLAVEMAWRTICGHHFSFNRALVNFNGSVDYSTVAKLDGCACAKGE